MTSKTTIFNARVSKVGDGGTAIHIPADIARRTGLISKHGEHIRCLLNRDADTLILYTPTSVEDIEINNI